MNSHDALILSAFYDALESSKMIVSLFDDIYEMEIGELIYQYDVNDKFLLCVDHVKETEITKLYLGDDDIAYDCLGRIKKAYVKSKLRRL